MTVPQRNNSSNKTNDNASKSTTSNEKPQNNTVTENEVDENANSTPTHTSNTAEIFIESAFSKVDEGSYSCDFKGKLKDGTKGSHTYKLVMDKEKFIGDGDDFNLLFKNAASNDSTLVNVMYEQGKLNDADVFYLIDIIKKVA